MLRAFAVFLSLLAVALLPGCSTMDSVMGKSPDLSSLLTRQLGVTEAQANGGIGSMLQVAQNKLKAGEFDQIAKAIPGSQKYLDVAKQALGATKLTDAAGLSSAFGKLGMSPDMVDKFKPLVTDYVGKAGGESARNLLAGALK